jgi:hypothetical protein
MRVHQADNSLNAVSQAGFEISDNDLAGDTLSRLRRQRLVDTKARPFPDAGTFRNGPVCHKMREELLEHVRERCRSVVPGKDSSRHE